MYVMTIFVIFYSMVDWWFSILLASFFTMYFLYLSELKTPGTPINHIHYVNHQWMLYRDSELVGSFEKVVIRFDMCGLIWLEWCMPINHEETKRSLFIFRDQCDPDAYRLLRILIRISKTIPSS